MKVGDVFTGEYLKAVDLRGKRVTVTISKVTLAKMPDGESKPLLHFKGKDRGLVLNKTNANAVWGINGSEDTDDWPGTQITLFPSKTDFQGRRVDCIRVDPPDGAEQRAQPQRKQPEPEPEPEQGDDSDCPF